MHTAQPLRDRFSRLAPGTYLTSSHNNAYGHLRALVIAGKAKMVGFKRMPRGETVITVRVGESAARANPTIGIGPEFFQGAIKDYSDWEEKWWREAVQNAVDAGATKIDLRSDRQPDGTYLVSCEDNGGGMTEDVLLNKFLVLGGSTKKDDTGAAGGFGKAKELLVLPWLDWRVHTRDKAAYGRGVGYDVESVPYLKGTRITVRMPADQYTYEAPALSFLSKCDLPKVHFTINGARAKTGVKGSKLIESVPGKFDIFLAESKSSTTNNIYIRTNGLYMFSRYTSTDIPGIVTVDLTGRSIELLTANRDGFRDWSASRELDRFVGKIAADKTSAFRASKGLIQQVYEGTGSFRSRRREADVTGMLGPIPDTGARKSISLDAADVERVVEAIGSFRESEESETRNPMGSNLPSKEIASLILNEPKRGAEHVQATLKQLVWEPDFMLVNEEEGFRVPKRFKPESMAPTVLRLAKVWTEFCRHVLILLGSDREYGVGFMFSRSAAAAYSRYSDRNWLLLNPLKDYRKLDGLLSVTTDMRWLYAAAIHECTHMADGISYHDESFAAALTHNIAKCADGFKAAKKIAGAIRMRGSAVADE